FDPGRGSHRGRDRSLHDRGSDPSWAGDRGLEGQGRKPRPPDQERSSAGAGRSIPAWEAIKSREGDYDPRGSRRSTSEIVATGSRDAANAMAASLDTRPEGDPSWGCHGASTERHGRSGTPRRKRSLGGSDVIDSCL